MKNRTKAMVFALTVGIGGAPSVASAQSNSDASDALVLTTLSPLEVSFVAIEVALVSSLAGVVSGMVTTSGVVMTAASLEQQQHQRAQIELYLRKNAYEVHDALAMGSGEFVDELAHGLELDVREHAALGRLMRRERAVLADLADMSKLTPERASQFVLHLAESIRADMTLAPALERAAEGS